MILPASKLCPLVAASISPKLSRNVENCGCIGKNCAVYVELRTPRIIDVRGWGSFRDEEEFFVYEGCGLVVQIPWRLVKAESKKAGEGA